MNNEASVLIDSLFERIGTAEKNTGERDKEAEAQINKHLVANPAAPYYMAQTIIMQEAALKQLNARVEELERNASAKPSSGGFLSGLFGGDQQTSQSNAQQSAYQSSAQPRSGWGSGNGSHQTANQSPNNQAYSQPQSNGRGSSFLGGALQTAAGVAGGMVVGNMLMNMFSHHSEADMANVINETPASSDLGAATEADQGGFGQAGFDQANMNQSDLDSGGFDQGGFDDMGGFDDFGSDDFI
ncbi:MULTISPECIES: DUF2076 domain-containing protein [Marinomonas]|uniref:DUF2076 domain-containing protein n=1 Tax=Marinomonas arctica TaxID=383750 RepID=A0A7H1J8J8_9GAMM|nr:MULTISPECIES: DUF2076 domain-containing protein [Marinomonas]MCS7487597.1 hypothetical protein [Marinomonas sp. BSi20414]QNT06814.1 DUF2076 domain-containing protein [Marinomonas arctica]GGN23570.1 hypothetical protein GCM10011350_12110 [Marinomonas arctica]